MKIAVLSTDNDGYHDFIPEELKNQHIAVTYINLYKYRYKYPSILHKGFNFISKTFFNHNLKRVHIGKLALQRLSEIGVQDCILITRADLFNVSTIIEIKKYTKKLVANFNDHTDKFPRIKKVYPYFDKVFSFEKKDCEKYGFTFLTNFIYTKEPIIKNVDVKVKYEVFSVSRWDRRIGVIEQIAKVLNQLKIPNRIIIVGNTKFQKSSNCHVEFSNTFIPIDEVQNLIRSSNVMLDIYRDDQSGLSFRIFESMYYRKKVITNNRDIVNYDFYNPNNILLVNEDASNITKEFFETAYQEINAEIYKQYTLESWVKKVFDLD